MRQSKTPLVFDGPVRYRIRVQGAVDGRWSDYLGGMHICYRSNTVEGPITTLTGLVIDQASLMGILNCLYNLGRPLLSVEYLGDA